MTDAKHNRNIEYSIRELERMIEQQERELTKLQSDAASKPQTEQTPLDTLTILADAYDDMAQSEPYLPYKESILPALIALSTTHQIAQESRSYLSTQRPSFVDAQKRLDAERSNLADQHALSTALRERISSLNTEVSARASMSTADVASEKLAELRARRRAYDADTKKLQRAFTSFIEKHLAVLLAVEELGGPVVSEMMDVDAEDLAVGFTAHGRLRKPRAEPDADVRQQRIDEIWGPAKTVERKRSGEWSEKTAAAESMKRLTEKLLNQLIKAEGNDAMAYVSVEKESAAARFLVRTKVAMFHPRDASKIRLVDFGRDLDE
ncbi:hypothetical protein TD95_001394 [Thielaviopsis punctulata]|uniref:Uncharacterized protein n=1 Tax=Thielaviopsis punctulata TaxID=72032 RepID=A0A0F4Z752_9PEZI|nr:hypothetical protein TD95_001394 [Thielaviopsis punctulata]